MLGRPREHCPDFCLIGVHIDGALAERLTLPMAQLFPVGDIDDPGIVAFVEPISIAVHAVNRTRVAEGEHVVVLGAGPIGQALSLAARERGAKVLLVDLVASRLELGRLTGADVLDASGGDDVVAEGRAWSGGEGPRSSSTPSATRRSSSRPSSSSSRRGGSAWSASPTAPWSFRWG